MKSSSTPSRKIWPEGPPRNDWHSFDSTPWLHPWLTRRNLRAMREASAIWREEARRVVERAGAAPSRFAFVGNMANGMYTRAKAVARLGVDIEVFGLYGDESVFADPRWEEFDGALPADASYLRGDNSFLDKVRPKLPFHRCTVTSRWAELQPADLPHYARLLDFRRWPENFCDLPALDELQSFDAVLAAQRPHLAYLSGKPYAATPAGGDWWLEPSRDDAFGRLQRASFGQAGCLWVSNPWNYTHARRYGFTNLLYLPLALNEDDYSPGPPGERARWEVESGGDFFVFSSARADDYYKGSHIGLLGFAEFARNHPGARLVFTSWGDDFDKIKVTISRLGLLDRVLLVPLSGKQKLIEYLRSADCLLDQFKLGYYGATGIEACACGLPVIIRMEEAQYAEFCETGAPPFLNADTSAEVVNALELLAINSERRALLAADHRSWFLKNHSGKRWAEDYHAVLGALALGHRFSFETSPLAKELSPAERLYHAEQLAEAPEFPTYEQPTAQARYRLLGRIRAMSLQLDDATARLASSDAERDAFRTLLADVSAERDALATSGAELATSLGTAEAQRSSLEQTLDNIYHSTPWRLTRPLRAAVTYFRKACQPMTAKRSVQRRDKSALAPKPAQRRKPVAPDIKK